MATFRVKGTVMEAETGRRLPCYGVVVRGSEILYDDLLGGTVTDENGRFAISGELDFDRDHSIRVLSFIILTPDGRKLPYSVKKPVNCEAWYPEEVDLRIPSDILIERKRDDLIAVEKAFICMGQHIPNKNPANSCDSMYVDTAERGSHDPGWDDLAGLLIP